MKRPAHQKLPWRWKGKQGYRIVQPGKEDGFFWKNGKPLTLTEVDDYLDSLQWP